jgi:hypothetical protein
MFLGKLVLISKLLYPKIFMTIPLFSREGGFPPADALCETLSCTVSPAFIDRINHPICLNRVDLQPAAYEVFYVSS